jgi:hypothetical protein
MLPPVYEIVNLVDIDDASEVLHGAFELPTAFTRRRGPDLGGDERIAASGSEPVAEHALGFAVHRRRIEQIGGTRERLFNGCMSVRFDGCAANVERAPRSEADCRHVEAARAEASNLH